MGRLSAQGHRPVLSCQGDVEIDLDGITCADRAGEQALLSLWQSASAFRLHLPFARDTL